MVERRDGRDHAHRLALGENLARLALRREIAGKNLPVIENAELARQREHVIGAARIRRAESFIESPSSSVMRSGKGILALADEFGRLNRICWRS